MWFATTNAECLLQLSDQLHARLLTCFAADLLTISIDSTMSITFITHFEPQRDHASSKRLIWNAIYATQINSFSWDFFCLWPQLDLRLIIFLHLLTHFHHRRNHWHDFDMTIWKYTWYCSLLASCTVVCAMDMDTKTQARLFANARPV